MSLKRLHPDHVVRVTCKPVIGRRRARLEPGQRRGGNACAVLCIDVTPRGATGRAEKIRVHDPLRSAYATLDLAPDAPLWRVRRQYKALVRKWHPDRFAGDPQGTAEATIRMRAINEAFDTITRTPGRTVDARRESAAAHGSEAAYGSRLSPEEIDQIVGAIQPAWTLHEWFADDPWNRALPLALVVIEVFVAGWQGWRHPYYRFTRIPQTNAMLGDALAVLMPGMLFLAMIWFEFDPSRIAWGSGRWAPSPAWVPKIVGWLGIVLLFLALPVAWILG